jgi:hypothetical protein
MKSKKQRRFERRLAERRLLQRDGVMTTSRQRRSERRLAEGRLGQQGGVVKTTGEPSKKPAVAPAEHPSMGECSKNPNAQTSGFQKPGESGNQKGKEMN